MAATATKTLKLNPAQQLDLLERTLRGTCVIVSPAEARKMGITKFKERLDRMSAAGLKIITHEGGGYSIPRRDISGGQYRLFRI